MNAAAAFSSVQAADAQRFVGGLHLCVYNDLAEIEATWRHIEESGIATAYQSFDWCRTWLKTVGLLRGVSPLVVVGRTAFGETKFILPLQLRQKFGVSVIEILSAPQGAYAFGLFQRSFLEESACVWFGDHFSDVITTLPRHDVLRLADSPSHMNGFTNPLLSCGGFLSANHSHVMQLQTNFQLLLEAKRTSETRRSLRKRDNKLEAAGTLKFGLPSSAEERQSVLKAMFADQEKRLAEAGVHNVFSAQEREFVYGLSDVNTPNGPFLRPYFLSLNGDVQAVLLGAHFGNCYWALISSLAESRYLKLSPGDYALRAMLNSLCEDGTTRLDFAAGDSAYKLNWSDQTVPLHLVLRASSMRGLLVSSAMLLREKTKRFIKQNIVLRDFSFKVRKLLSGRKSAT